MNSTTQTHTLLYKLGFWQGLQSQWTSRASVGL